MNNLLLGFDRIGTQSGEITRPKVRTNAHTMWPMSRKRRENGSAGRRRTRSYVKLSSESQRIIEELAAIEAQRERVADTARHMRHELDETINRNRDPG